jgi:hypothetical protein
VLYQAEPRPDNLNLSKSRALGKRKEGLRDFPTFKDQDLGCLAKRGA